MGKLTRFSRRIIKPAAMVAVVGALSLSLIVTTPSNAEAFQGSRHQDAVEYVLKGAQKVAAPAAQVGLAAASFTPVGAVVRIGSLALTAYSTQDIWMPWVSGLWGAAKDKDGPAASGYRTAAKVSNVVRNGHQITATYTIPGGERGIGGSWYQQFGVLGQCKNNATGKIAYHASSGWWSLGNSSSTRTLTTGALNACPSSSWTLEGWKVGGGSSASVKAGSWAPRADGNTGSAAIDGSGSYQYGTTNLIEGGTWGEPGFDPYADGAKYKVRSECIDSSGNKSTIEAESWGDMLRVPSCGAAGKGHGTGKTSIVGLAPGSTQEESIWESQPFPDQPETPLCNTSRSTGGCELSVELDGKPCTAGNVECESWASEHSKSENDQRYKCRFGPYTLPMSACGLLEKAYTELGAPATQENTDGDPATQGGNHPNGSPVAAPAPVVAPRVPGSAGSVGTVPDASTKEKECFPSGWGLLNPIEWVMKPVGCALSAAFEPKKPVEGRITAMRAQFANKVPMTWLGIGTNGISGGACPSHWQLEFRGKTYPFICGTTADGIVQTFRPILGGMLVIAAVFPLIRSLFYSAIPVFKVNPS